jgi:two-component system, chemotaxis family, protein-glutamate methylesterase/glutaminase
MEMTPPIRVLVVDDSAVARQIVSRELGRDSGIEVVATSSDATDAAKKIASFRPTVITLDIQMPGTDGLTFLRALMATSPHRVVVLSALTTKGSRLAIEALELGAFAVVCKPSSSIALNDTIDELKAAIKAAAQAKDIPSSREFLPVQKSQSSLTAKYDSKSKIIALGASTGGTEAIKSVLTGLEVSTAPVVAVIHMPEGFTARYAERLDELCRIQVKEAVDGELLFPGLAVIARGDQHLAVQRAGPTYRLRTNSGPKICRHRPSVDYLFHSVAKAAGQNGLGILMTGMGADGADGLLSMRQAGAHTIAQDEDSCVVYGMPKEAVNRNAAVEVLPLDHLSGACIKFSNRAVSV